MAEVWIREYPVTPPHCTDPCEWFQDKQAAIEHARNLGAGAKVEAVVKYLDDRRTILTVGVEDD